MYICIKYKAIIFKCITYFHIVSIQKKDTTKIFVELSRKKNETKQKKMSFE